MPTALPLHSRNANAALLRSGVAATANPDLLVVVAFGAIGLLLTAVLTVFFPAFTASGALAWTVS